MAFIERVEVSVLYVEGPTLQPKLKSVTVKGLSTDGGKSLPELYTNLVLLNIPSTIEGWYMMIGDKESLQSLKWPFEANRSQPEPERLRDFSPEIFGRYSCDDVRKYEDGYEGAVENFYLWSKDQCQFQDVLERVEPSKIIDMTASN